MTACGRPRSRCGQSRARLHPVTRPTLLHCKLGVGVESGETGAGVKRICSLHPLPPRVGTRRPRRRHLIRQPVYVWLPPADNVGLEKGPRGSPSCCRPSLWARPYTSEHSVTLLSTSSATGAGALPCDLETGSLGGPRTLPFELHLKGGPGRNWWLEEVGRAPGCPCPSDPH